MRDKLAFLGGVFGGLALVVCASASCGDEDRPAAAVVGGPPTQTSSSSGGNEAGTLQDGGDDGTPSNFDAAMCQAAPLVDAVPVTERRAEAPTPLGGTLVEGTFVLWESYVFKPRSADAGEEAPHTIVTDVLRQRSIVIADGMIAISSAEGTTGGGVGAPSVSAGTYTVDGTNLVVSLQCPSSSEVTFGYTASETGLVLFDANGAVDIYRLLE